MGRQEHDALYLLIKPDRETPLLPQDFLDLPRNTRSLAEILPLIQVVQSLKDYEIWLKSLSLKNDDLAQFDLHFPLNASSEKFPGPQLFLESAGFSLHPFLAVYTESQKNSYSAIRTGAEFALILYFLRLMHEGKVPWERAIDEIKTGKIKKGHYKEGGREWEVYFIPNRSFSIGFTQITEGKGHTHRWIDSYFMRMDSEVLLDTAVLKLDLEAKRFQRYTQRSIDILEILFGPNRHHVSLGDGRGGQCELIARKTMEFLNVADLLL